ncbi:pectinesterase family protein [Aliifodinibius sp. S!AR15-10]|uniref:pectinesterase family protein n=1 Tax=Aliifodinibius sp. S!AR15-10 TaxID=2950437 RepID=UPI00285F84A9|nr:pectinesterase family protein [Aliifodinibius sp. S!AR15-10]MDR8393604.1 pectinesterase family protein [Aliifodinibius sp. S!AR15-10]
MKKRNFLYPVLYPFVLLLVFSCSSNQVAPEEEESREDLIEYKYVVDKDGNGDFTSVQEAIDAAPSYYDDRTYIYVKNGEYKEVVTIPDEKTNLTLVGESVENVILTYDNAAQKINPETGEEYGTSGSASTYIHGDGFVAVNITFENSAGYYNGTQGKTNYGQTLAIYVDSDQSIFDNCRFISGQDTFYAGRVRTFIKDSYIEGTTDFIFGPATAVFENTNMHSYGGTSITAASTESYVEFGFVFRNCTITSESGVKTDLGRPWRPYAAVAYLGCDIGSCIKPEGWNNWGDPDNEATARYAEYNNTGPGADTDNRINWVDILTEGEAEKYETLNVLKTTYEENPNTDDWNPYNLIEQMQELPEM